MFTAGQTKTIEADAAVGFHGNVNAVIKEAGGAEHIPPFYMRWLPGSDYQAYVDGFKKEEQAEASFFERLKIPQSFFDRTQRPDKGEGDGLEYNFLFPTKQTFIDNGILNVVGTQSAAKISWIEAISKSKMLLK